MEEWEILWGFWRGLGRAWKVGGGEEGIIRKAKSRLNSF